MGADARSRTGNRPAAPRRTLLPLVALTTLAGAQPLLATLGRFGEFLVAHQLTGGEIIALATGLVVVPPLVLWLVVRLVGALAPRLGALVFLLVAGFLAAAWALQGARAIGLSSPTGIPLALALGTLAGWALHRSRGARRFLALASLAAPLTLAGFLVWSPASRLLLTAEPDVAAASKADGTAANRAAEPPPLVLIVFDELPFGSLLTREGEIDSDRFPNFATLASDSRLFDQATSVGSGTAYAVPAILSGRYPRQPHLPTYLEYPENLFTLLGDSYRLHVHETLTQLCPQRLCAGERPPAGERAAALASDLRIIFLHLALPADLAARLPSISGTWRDFAAQWEPDEARGVLPTERGARLDIPGQVARYIEELSPEDGVLHYLHLELPHVPWRFLPSGTEYGPVSRKSFALGVDHEAVWRDEPWLVTLALQRHLAQVMYTDRVLGQLIAGLEAHGLYDRATLIVTADHGLAFQIGEPGRAPTTANAGEVAAVPLFLRTPGDVRGRRDSLPVEVIDILPTLAQVAGVAPPWPVDGRSLLDPSYRGRERRWITVPTQGLRVLLTPPAVAASTLAAAGRIANAFGRPGRAGLFEIGPHVELLGRPLADLEARGPGRYQAAIEQRWLYDRVDPSSGFIPARVDGRLRSGESNAGRRPVAIAVNGVVRAVTQSFPERGGESFSALLPEESFAPGANRVQIFVVDTTESGAVLVATEDLSGPGYRLTRDADGTLTGIAATNGTGCVLEAGAVRGEVRRNGLSYRGWALDPTGAVPRAVVMAFVEDDLVWAGPTGEAPPAFAVSRDLPGFDSAGFEFGLTRPLLGHAESGAVQLFGVIGERCSPLAVE